MGVPPCGQPTASLIVLASLCVVWRGLASQHVLAHASAGQEVPPHEKAGRTRKINAGGEFRFSNVLNFLLC